MRTDSVKKYVIPNIPYLFILWACLKLGTAYRLAPGADFAHKLMGLGQSIGPAFADFAPGLHPFDWLIGIVGAVGFRLLIYMKSKNAKKFRRDEEYGSARWGTEKDIKPFVDPKFENNVILTKTEFLTMNTRPKIPANARNLNACIIGSSGSGKTRFWLTPQLLQAHSSYVCVDPKGGVLSQVGAFLQRRGYKVKVFNSIDFSKSMHYNPLSYKRGRGHPQLRRRGRSGCLCINHFWTKCPEVATCRPNGRLFSWPDNPGEMEDIWNFSLLLSRLCRLSLLRWALAWACGVLSICWRGTARTIRAPKARV